MKIKSQRLILLFYFIASVIPGIAQQDTALYKQAFDLTDKGEFKLAIELFTKAITINKNFADAYYDRGRCYINLNEYKMANSDIENALKLDSTYSQAYTAHGMLAFRNKHYNEALSDANKAIHLDSLNCEAMNNRGACFFYRKEYKAALTDFLNAVRIGKKAGVVKYFFYTNLSDAYYKLKDYVKAIEAANNAIEMDKNKRDAYERRAYAYEKLDMFDEADSDLKTARKLQKQKIYNAD